MTEQKTRSLASKLAYVMTQVKYIQKRGRNSFHGYNYATEADVNDKVREVLAEQNIIMLPSLKDHSIRETTTVKGATEYIACVNMEFTFVDGDSGEQFTITMSGEGQDRGDKAIYKAISGTQKYALMKLFMIPTGDDPEDDGGDKHPQPQQQSKPQQKSNNSRPQHPQHGPATDGMRKTLSAACKQAGMGTEQCFTFMDDTIGHHDTNKLTAEEVSRLITALPSYKEVMAH